MKKTEQKIIMGTSQSTFKEEVNDYLKEGWNLISGSAKIAATNMTPYFMIGIEREVDGN